MTYDVTVKGISIIGELDDLKRLIPLAASRALNRIAAQTRTKSARLIRQQLNFRAGYLAPSGGRLTVGKKASRTKLESSVRGRSRPTSLAQFAKGAAKRGKGVRVAVKPGRTRHLKKAFLINLRAGNAESGNIGLAIRSDTKPGRAYKPKKIGKNLWLLYGPSVGQALINARQSGIWTEIEAEVGADLQKEFLRLIQLDI